jgi:hypothetical protein
VYPKELLEKSYYDSYDTCEERFGFTGRLTHLASRFRLLRSFLSSAGVGRTGTFIALASLLRRGDFKLLTSPLGPLPADLSQDQVAITVDNIRECRAFLVQNIQQLGFIYEMVNSSQLLNRH